MTGTERRQDAALKGDGRVAIIAGGGALPVAVARTLAQQGADPFVVVIAGEADDPAAFAQTDHILLRAEELGLLLPKLKKKGVARLVLAGNMERRPRLAAIRWGFSTLALLPRVAAAYLRGDDGLLRALIAILEQDGIQVVGAHEIVPDLLAPAGLLTKARPSERDRRDIEAASIAALAIGRLDIGQGAIAIGGRAVALEGIEGTDGLLQRTAALRGHGRLAGRQRGVLVKRCKPGQEQRADLPAIGPVTIEGAKAAGLAGVAVDAGRSFILDFERTIELADRHGLFVVGLEPAEEGA